MPKPVEILKDTALTAEDIVEPVAIPVEAYTSPEYARAERDRLWRKVWLQAGRLEDLADVGSYLTFEILDDSIVVVRTATDRIKAFHNVCPHRGRRLVDTPAGERNGCGKKKMFICAYHGWRFDLDGNNTHIPQKDDWQGCLTAENTHLAEVKHDTWGGWIWVNMDPQSESLREYLGVIPDMLDPFQLQNMRVRWRKWGIFDCNWKVAMEAFNETYHVETTHPEFNKYGSFRGWARAHGRHSHIGYEAPKDMDANQQAKLRLGSSGDPRLSTAEMQTYTWEKANTNTTQTLVNAALRLKDELPEGTPGDQVLKHWLASARRDDEARGVVWPTVDPQHVGKSGTAWQVFPNFQIGHAVNNMLCYSARPYGYDPDKCIFEGAVYELYPQGQEPQTPWQFSPATAEAWCYVLSQDFSNMAAVQQGMKSLGFKGPRPNPYMERTTANLHRNLAKYMGTGSPKKLK
ncbi:MAG TPA: aromatic ring-hydroxylating dioxygenase subunit alpha [Povalibacter sp.]|uniref:aromatic ring-hydroxylating oxygenase subunit alpha n=1 Tax=Povalibacter sp. TaxID=1962978 RepID=UPI002C092E92|nr:aromatic ring-hydroxylating dioxygenase subunit alpha [Povalibacter sp.]HMN43625.1 aromatic ring-hydroxylating dioxygenase subunit alpha [Povalibacter sp.]